MTISIATIAKCLQAWALPVGPIPSFSDSCSPVHKHGKRLPCPHACDRRLLATLTPALQKKETENFIHSHVHMI